MCRTGKVFGRCERCGDPLMCQDLIGLCSPCWTYWLDVEDSELEDAS